MQQTASDIESQIFLPFTDPLYKEESGWQFAVLPTEKSRYSQTKFSLRFLCRDGSSFQVPDPIVVSAQEGAGVPEPIWAWVPIETDEGTKLAHPALPKRKQGSVPLKEAAREIFYTPQGIRTYGIEQEKCDLPHSLRAPDAEQIKLGQVPICELDAKDGQVLAVRPNVWPIAKGLWTSHLSRIIFVRAAQGQKL